MVVVGLTLTAVPLVTARLPGVITPRAIGENGCQTGTCSCGDRCWTRRESW